MALFDTPSLLGKIWEKQTFPEGGGGLAGLVGGFTGGFSAGRDYKNTPKGERNFVSAMQDAAARGAENSAEISQPLHPIQRRVANQNLAMNTFKLQEAITSRDIAVKTREGMAKLNSIMAESLGENADPDMILKRLYEVGSQYAFPPEAFDGVVKSVETMRQRKAQAAQFNNLLGGAEGMEKTVRATDPVTGATVTLSTPNKMTAERLEELAVQAENSGDIEAAQRYRNAIPNYQSRGFITKLTDINAKIAELKARASATKSNMERRDIEAEVLGLEAKKKYYEDAGAAEPVSPDKPADNDPLGLFR